MVSLPMFKCTNLFPKFTIDKVTLEIFLVFKFLDGNGQLQEEKSIDHCMGRDWSTYSLVEHHKGLLVAVSGAHKVSDTTFVAAADGDLGM